MEHDLLQIIEAKEGNKETCLAYYPERDNPWKIMIGNDSQNARLGEIGGEQEAEGKTPQEAILKMKHKLNLV